MCNFGVATDQCDATANTTGLQSASRTCSSFLGKLGRLFNDDPRATPKGCDHDRGRFGNGSRHSHLQCSGTVRFSGSRQGFEPPSWRAFSHGARPQRELDERELGITRRGWQHEAASRVEQRFRELFFPDSLLMKRGRSGSLCSAFLCCPSLRSPFVVFAFFYPQSLAPADVAVHLTLFATIVQRAAEQGCWAGEGLHWSVGARICREAGVRVSTNVYVRDLDFLAPDVHDARRLEIIAEGLSMFGSSRARFTPHWSQHTTVTESPERTPQPGMAQQWWQVVGGRKPFTQIVICRI